VPAAGLYRALLAFDPAPATAVPIADAERLATWLSAGHRSAAAALLTAGTRIPQEAVGRDLADTLDSWLT
jgi:hypothetical protein